MSVVSEWNWYFGRVFHAYAIAITIGPLMGCTLGNFLVFAAMAAAQQIYICLFAVLILSGFGGNQRSKRLEGEKTYNFAFN